MNAHISGTSSLGLSVQPQVIICPKCQHQRTAADQGPDWQCPGCGIAYNKATPPSPAVAVKVNSLPRERVSRETDDDELEPVTPGVFSFSLRGRIGRLRYLAFSWPVIVLSGLLGIVAAIIVPQHKTPGMVLLVLAGVFCFWMPLRLMALRMHDVNQSSKWLLALLLLPGVGAVLGGAHLATLCAGLFWIVWLLLVVFPGSEGDNDYGPPPEANTTLIKVGAGIFLVLTVIGVIGNIRMMHSGNVQNGAGAPTQAARP